MYENHILNYDNNNYSFYQLITEYFKKKYKNFKYLETIHELLDTGCLLKEDNDFYKSAIPIFGKTDRKSIFVKEFYKLFDSDYSFLLQYLNFIINEIKPLFHNENKLVIQKTPNIRFHLPNCSNIGKLDTDPSENVIGLHCDSQFNHPESECNFVIPITQMFDTNSIYYENTPNSDSEFEKYSNIKMDKNNFFMGYLNKCKHYNKINKTDLTRVSLDFRVIPYSKFVNNNKSSLTGNNKFQLGHYYITI